MKVKCFGCGFDHEIKGTGEEMCPKCGCRRWHTRFTEYEKLHDEPEREKLKDLLEETYFLAKSWLEEKGYMTFRKLSVPNVEYRVRRKEEDLAFEIFNVKDGKKVEVRKIYLNGHIEGFEGDPCIINHILPKIMALKALLRQMNKDYRDLIEAYMIRGLPLENVPLHELYMREMEGIENIKI